ncbi:helix-turn-helix domain-containing protein [Aureimonas sp. AU40]|uniref:helix-turn-helix domain-containing protein n=1 Tax=Aureimonas sp. AU40 TaxID=1637747 RepID=UPI000781798C|nr:helix-turn-helix domain-containing protein [Aureimonas sp. AU40]
MRYVFDSSSVDVSDPIGQHHDLYAGGTDVRQAGPRFRARIEVCRLAPLVVFDRRLDDVLHERTIDGARRDGFSHFTLQLVVSGRMRIEHPGGQAEAGPGEIVLFDLTRPQRTLAQDARILTFAVPRHLMERATIHVTALHGTVLGPQQSGLLADIMMSIVSRRLDEAGTDPASVVRIFETALALALRFDRDAADPPIDTPAMLDRVRVVVEAHLGRRELTPALVAKLAGVSRTQLYAAFKPVGGVSRYIQERRVTRLRSLLQSPENQGSSIAQLAFQAGFASASHANRSFCEVYGTTPGRFRLAQDKPLPSEAGQPPFYHWLRGLN